MFALLFRKHNGDARSHLENSLALCALEGIFSFQGHFFDRGLVVRTS